jgi:hypothetical protein
METTAVFLVLFATAYAVFGWGLSHWGSDRVEVLTAVIAGGFATATLTVLGLVFAAINVCSWFWQHVRLEVTL